jgi:HD-GYP domain-containing protein (c-di-GMP phosphodiesterase class II)
MTSDRAYRKALPHGAAVTEIGRCAGSQFDPDLANEFIETIEAHHKAKSEQDEPAPS